jgi:hypothetical protein
MDFSALSHAESADTERFMVSQEQVEAWSLFPDSTLLASVDLKSHDSVRSDVSVDVPCPGGCGVNAVLVFPELDLIEGISISTDPARAAATCSWHPYAYRLPSPIQIAAGGTARVRYRYRSSGKTLEVSAL